MYLDLPSRGVVLEGETQIANGTVRFHHPLPLSMDEAHVKRVLVDSVSRLVSTLSNFFEGLNDFRKGRWVVGLKLLEPLIEELYRSFRRYDDLSVRPFFLSFH